MVPMATSEVREAVRDYLQKHEYPTIAGFIDNHVDLIVPNTPSNKSIDKFWTSVIYQEAKKLNKTLSKSRVSWKKLFAIAIIQHIEAPPLITAILLLVPLLLLTTTKATILHLLRLPSIMIQSSPPQPSIIIPPPLLLQLLTTTATATLLLLPPILPHLLH
ncbi:hypothetical protein BDC45DRAFT_527744 [Circinella umbellata]|nr:hypothetical protein BDC45DRAFT_527744 [Circinella umbellata]